jgi:hypothetical protein
MVGETSVTSYEYTLEPSKFTIFSLNDATKKYRILDSTEISTWSMGSIESLEV